MPNLDVPDSGVVLGHLVQLEGFHTVEPCRDARDALMQIGIDSESSANQDPPYITT